ncbi:Wzy polymerase domain-containing protein [Paenibacillus crassostreae]|uniref:Polymerase n=1 Tax=Paenibacillus crassostreae TaxID=1763538 RepID=A0A167E2I5_9BACL|nr:Wzy polymerase domain-containing protein [Paenibacillus crassostreae]AOZ93294.1 polymerase [Paenibacillus crassostreae]OAB75061.1 polymerase [Paenibacillus crassostreae]
MSKQVYGKQAKRSSDVIKLPVLSWVLMAALILYLAWTPFQVALFNGQMLNFEKPIFWAAALACVILLIWIAKDHKSINLEGQRDWMAIWVLLLPITFVLSLFGAASHYLAMNMVIIQCTYAIMFIIGLFLLRDKLANKVIQIAIMTVAYIIVGFGLLNWFGQGTFAGKLVNWFSSGVLNGKYTDAVMSDSNGLRLTSVFQYANTYAAFLMAFLFATVFLLIRSKKWYGQAIHAFMLVPIILSVLLTLSRGGLVMLPVVFVLLLLFLKPVKQILWVVYIGIAGIASLLISSTVTELGLQLNTTYNGSEAAKGWGILLFASAVVALLGWVIQRFVAPLLERGLQAWSERKTSSLWIPVGSVIVVGAVAFLLIGTSARNILPENMSTRLENINFQQHSVLERITFYKDAMKVVQDYPVLGAGGGAWGALYEKYQNNPYISRQAHNFFLQYLVEVGIVGFVIFMAFLIYIFYKYIRHYITESEEERESHFLYLILVLSILLHSLLDFNMSYVFIGIIVYLGLGGMASVMENKSLRIQKLRFRGSGVSALYSLVLGICAIVVLFTSFRYIQASSASIEASELSQTSSSYEEIKAPLDKDLSLRKNHPDSVLLLSSLYQEVYSQNQSEEFYDAAYNVITEGLKDEPYNKYMINRLITLHQLKGEQEQAFDLLVANSENFNWDIEWYERIISQAHELGYAAHGMQDLTLRDKYFTAGIEAFNKIQSGLVHLATLPEGQLSGRAFANTPSMILNTGKMQLLLNQPAESIETFKLGLIEDLTDPTNREIARWYVAALMKQGLNDQAVLDRLIQIDPTETEQIEAIVQSIS